MPCKALTSNSQTKLQMPVAYGSLAVRSVAFVAFTETQGAWQEHLPCSADFSLHAIHPSNYLLIHSLLSATEWQTNSYDREQ